MWTFIFILAVEFRDNYISSCKWQAACLWHTRWWLEWRIDDGDESIGRAAARGGSCEEALDCDHPAVWLWTEHTRTAVCSGNTATSNDCTLQSVPHRSLLIRYNCWFTESQTLGTKQHRFTEQSTSSNGQQCHKTMLSWPYCVSFTRDVQQENAWTQAQQRVWLCAALEGQWPRSCVTPTRSLPALTRSKIIVHIDNVIAPAEQNLLEWDDTRAKPVGSRQLKLSKHFGRAGDGLMQELFMHIRSIIMIEA